MNYLIDQDGTSRLRAFTGITTIQVLADEDITYYIENAEAQIMRKTGMKFYDVTTTEYYDGDGGKLLALKNYPLRAVSAINIYTDNLQGTTYSTIDSACYHIYWDKAMIYYDTSEFPKDNQNIEVTYTYGAPSAEDFIKFRIARDIAFKTVAKQMLLAVGNIDSHGFESERLEQYSLSYGKGPYSFTISQLDREIKEAYDILGIAVDAEII